MQQPALKNLPIGVQLFENLIERNYIYVDKTKHVYRLVSHGQYYFLSRPRRFGKSLLVSTFQALFEGKRDLFKGLWIVDSSDYAWPTYPVICIDFSVIDCTSTEEFKIGFLLALKRSAFLNDIAIDPTITSPQNFLVELVVQLASRSKKVVVLIDEYDRPILEHIVNPEVRDPLHVILKNFYTALKGVSGHIHFLFITGVSKFSKTSLFSGFNNLLDISVSESTATIVGYTEEELYTHFDGWIVHTAAKLQQPVSVVKDQVRAWYDGYRFSDNPTRLYNPFSILTFFWNAKFSDYWFSSGTPTFLMRLLKKGDWPLSDLENIVVPDINFPAYDIDNQELVPLMFQTGYLTVKDHQNAPQRYTLSYPNIEVRTAFFTHFIKTATGLGGDKVYGFQQGILHALEAGNTEKFIATLRVFFAGIPYEIQPGSDASGPSESYYQSLFFALLRGAGMHVHAEVRTNQGRIDLTVETKNYVYIIECKINASCAIALEQIYAKKYYEPYLQAGKQIVLMGLVFDTKARALGECLVEMLTSGEPKGYL